MKTDINEKYYDIIENLGWDIELYHSYADIRKYTDAGEDFFFTVDLDNIPQEVYNYAANFDAEEHVAMWLNAKANGVSGAPDIYDLIEDADRINEDLIELAKALLQESRGL